ncbi:hypothetical protein G7046_g564 [Stylonectria norvegica]|nr:hypothetical protein G7046_g564 [Stylonectria norvegica]
MVSLKQVQQSNAGIGALPKGLVALFIGATSGIGQSTLENFARHASAPHIYSVARPQTAESHQQTLRYLAQHNPAGTYSLIKADVSLVSEIDRVVDDIKSKESKIDILFLSSGFMPFEGPPINEADLDVRDASNWSFWNASVHSTTMGTLSLERIARDNPRLSIVHWYPGPVATPGLAKAKKFGMSPPDQMSQGEAGQRALFLATNDRYSVEGGLITELEGLGRAARSGGGIFLIDPQGEATDNESVLASLRSRHVDEAVWTHTLKIFDQCAGVYAKTHGDEL